MDNFSKSFQCVAVLGNAINPLILLFSFWPHFQNIFDKNAVLMKGGIDGAVGGAEGGAEAIEGGGIVQVLGACGGEADGEDVAQE